MGCNCRGRRGAIGGIVVVLLMAGVVAVVLAIKMNERPPNTLAPTQSPSVAPTTVPTAVPSTATPTTATPTAAPSVVGAPTAQPTLANGATATPTTASPTAQVVASSIDSAGGSGLSERARGGVIASVLTVVVVMAIGGFVHYQKKKRRRSARRSEEGATITGLSPTSSLPNPPGRVRGKRHKRKHEDADPQTQPLLRVGCTVMSADLPRSMVSDADTSDVDGRGVVLSAPAPSRPPSRHSSRRVSRQASRRETPQNTPRPQVATVQAVPPPPPNYPPPPSSAGDQLALDVDAVTAAAERELQKWSVNAGAQTGNTSDLIDEEKDDEEEDGPLNAEVVSLAPLLLERVRDSYEQADGSSGSGSDSEDDDDDDVDEKRAGELSVAT